MAFAVKDGRLPVPDLGAIADWPWTLVRLISYQQQIQYARQMASLKKAPVPPNEYILSRYWTDMWIEENKVEKSTNA